MTHPQHPFEQGQEPPSGYQYPSQPRYVTGQSGTPPAQPPPYGAYGASVPPETPKPPRKWYQKKRFLIPAGLVLLMALPALLNGGGRSSTQTAAAPVATTPAPAPTTQAAATQPPATQAPAESPAPAETTQPAASPTQTAPEVTEEAATMSQRQAVRQANDYLDYTAFSRKGLIEQLEFEGFSKADATYAVDHIEVDWMEQAALKAKDYLDYTAFSRKGLIEQLEFEGFTKEQATHGANAVGLK